MPPPLDYRHAVLHYYAVLHRRIIGDFHDILPFYRGCVRVERPRPKILTGLSFGVLTDRRRRSAVRLVDAGNSSHAHSFCGARDLHTLNSWRIARFWLALVECFDLFPSFSLFAQLVLFVSPLTASPMREALPLALPASLLARGLTARFGSRIALCSCFTLLGGLDRAFFR